MPNLIEVQKASYDQFLIVDEPEGTGVPMRVCNRFFKSVFPITDFAGTALARVREATSSSSPSTTSTSAVSAA
jgi:hypothetical protein